MKISIIIPVYNKKDTLSNCFDSVLNQIDTDCGKYEIIVVDDGSEDGSSAIINQYADRYKIISVIRQKNSGVSVARNNAIDMASGEYVLFLDGDDELIEGSLNKIHNVLSDNTQLDMLVSRQTIFYNNDEVLVKAPPLEERKKYDGVEAFNCKYVRSNAGGGICRTEFLRKNNLYFPVGIRNAEDTIFFGVLQVYAKSIMYVNIPLYRINIVYGSASHSDSEKLALRHIETLNAMSNIRKQIKCTEKERGIIEYVTYQLTCNTIFHFVKAKNLGYKDFFEKINMKILLPFEIKYMSMMKNKAMLMNFSCKLFYFISWIKHGLKKNSL